MKRYLLLMLLVLKFSISFSEILTITYRPPASKNDIRFKYPLELVKLAMEKTATEYGGYAFVQSNRMNVKRASQAQYIKQLENFIFETAATVKNDKELLPIKIPLYKGLFGFRLFLIDKNRQKEFNKIKTINQLKSFKIGQNKAWTDAKILIEYGFTVVHGPSYEGLFGMLLSNRFDIFSRGVHEAFREQEMRSEELENLVVEKKLAIYYPLPRYFYTAKKNKEFAERLEKGLKIMIDDGSFDKIWLEYYGDIIKKSDLKNRKIFYLSNPFLPSDVPFDQEEYWYVPE